MFRDILLLKFYYDDHDRWMKMRLLIKNIFSPVKDYGYMRIAPIGNQS